jgi:hypothetical protein
MTALNELTICHKAERTGNLFLGCFNDTWFEEEEGEKVEMYWDEWSAIAEDAEGNKFKAVWRFKNYKDGRLEDDCLDWDSEPFEIKEI